MLTLNMLKAMPPYTIFATGLIADNREGLNMTNSGKELRWVAVRREMHDWSVYCNWSSRSSEWVKEYGDKVLDESSIKKLVPCDDEAYKMYAR